MACSSFCVHYFTVHCIKFGNNIMTYRFIMVLTLDGSSFIAGYKYFRPDRFWQYFMHSALWYSKLLCKMGQDFLDVQ